ncbi:MAG: BLUF domain-containing protein [Lysobacteraceae bacterium]|nr:MAG: BLUF domain-containing protein [Xanthomonadaceae bacterium]
MANLFALTYLSRATRELLPEELDAIRLQARLFNAAEQVTGVLLHGEGRFFQLLEGPETSVRKVLDRLSHAQAHKGIHLLSQGPIVDRSFASWHMGFAHAPRSVMQGLSQFAWEAAIPCTRGGAGSSAGLGLVVHFWETWSADADGSA